MISVAKSIVRARLGGWVLGVSSTVSELSGIGAGWFRVALLLGLYFSPAITLAVYASLYGIIRLTGLASVSRRDDDEELLLESEKVHLRLTEDFGSFERKLARMEAEALSADAITRARFRNAGF